MRKFFTALIVIPLGLIFIIFAVANRHLVTVSFDPFNSSDPTVAVTLPLFVVIIAVAILGVIAGGSTTWFRQRRWRRAARQHEADARQARAEADALRAAARGFAGRSAAASGAVSRRPLRVRRARQAGRDVVEPAPSADVHIPFGRPQITRPSRTMSLLVKICGLSTRETLDVALEAGADMVGFVFFPPSPRHLSLGAARELGKQAKGRAVKVALTVDADDATLENIIETLRPDILQLHGKETTARLRDIKSKFGLPVMKAMPVETAADLAPLAGYAGVADRILFDARAPKGCHPSRRAGRRVRLACAGEARSRAALHGLGRAQCRQCRGSRPRHPRGRRRCVVGGRACARRQGSRADPRLHPRRARHRTRCRSRDHR